MRAHETAVALENARQGYGGIRYSPPKAATWDRITTMAGRARANSSNVHRRLWSRGIGYVTLNACNGSSGLPQTEDRNDCWAKQRTSRRASRMPSAETAGVRDPNVKIWHIPIGVEIGALGSELAALANKVDEARLNAHPARKGLYGRRRRRVAAIDAARRRSPSVGRCRIRGPRRIPKWNT